KPGRPARRVRLEPYALLSRGDRVYLFGFDLDRQARRTFRLSRVEGAIAKLSGREPGDYSIPEDFSPQLALQSSSEMAVGTEARLSIDAHRADPLRRRQVRAVGDDVIIEFTDAQALAAEIVGFGDAVTALEPPELVRAVEDRRETIRESLVRLGGASVLSARATDPPAPSRALPLRPSRRRPGRHRRLLRHRLRHPHRRSPAALRHRSPGAYAR